MERKAPLSLDLETHATKHRKTLVEFLPNVDLCNVALNLVGQPAPGPRPQLSPTLLTLIGLSSTTPKITREQYSWTLSRISIIVGLPIPTHFPKIL